MDILQVASSVVVAAVVSGSISLLVAWVNRDSALQIRDKQTAAENDVLAAKINADFQLALKKVDAETVATMSERAWVDYELRRDAYVQLARLIGCLFEGGNAAEKPDFHKTARQVRLVGSDEVVKALNSMTADIKNGGHNADTRYRALFNAMRRDIRRIHTLPPEGTALGKSAFPIES